MTPHLLLLIILIVSALLAAGSKSFLYSAIWLSVLSITLTGVMFLMNAPWAGIFELSVCAGLITVLFAGTASMVGKGRQYAANERRALRFLPIALLAFAGLLIVCFKKFAPAFDGTGFVRAVTAGSVGDILWRARGLDLTGEICIFVAAVLMVKTFFGGRSNE